MSLPTGTDLVAYLRIPASSPETQPPGTSLCDLLVGDAIAAVQGYIGRRITATSVTFIDPATTERAYDQVRTLQLREWPFAAANPAPVVTDVDAVVVDPTTYRLEPRWGQIIGNEGIDFSNGPYTITATVGLSTDPDYATLIEPRLRRAILDLAADWYQRRNPGAATEAAGGGVSVTYTKDGMPARICAVLDEFIVPRIGVLG